MNSFTKDWEDWLNTNISQGNCKIIMFKKSLEAGYNYDLIKNKLNIDYEVDKMTSFTKDWELWINYNMSRGNCKKIMFEKLLEAGYKYDLIKDKLNIDYEVSKPLVSSLKNNISLKNKIALKNAVKLNTDKLEIYKLENFLTKEECVEIIKIINESELFESSTFNSGASNINSSYTNNYRTSKTCHFYDKYPFINEIESRICKTIGINNRNSELIQGQKYSVGQEFKVHTDYFDENLLKNNNTINGNQRTWTFMIYLNDLNNVGDDKVDDNFDDNVDNKSNDKDDDNAGGHTVFPYSYISAKPKTGTAIIWNNLDENMKTNIFSSHCGMPIIKGEKYILTKWFRYQEMNLSIKNEICENHFLPIFHKIGFEKVKLESDCIDKIKKWMKENEDNFILETGTTSEVEKNMVSNILDINKAPIELTNNLLKEMKELLTKWICYKSVLKHVATYGIREYTKGSSLGNHYDKKNTHVISAIIHLESDKPWELYIEDHNFKAHQITVDYGDIIFYESTTCLHGRPIPYEGESYRNMYIHFIPERWCDNLS
jgi:prolyl 4-hydroxylase